MRRLSMVFIVLCSCSYEYVYNTTVAPDGGEELLDAGQGNDGAVVDTPDGRRDVDAGQGNEDAALDTLDAAADASSEIWVDGAVDTAVVDPGLGQCEVCEYVEDCREGFVCTSDISRCFERVEINEECDTARELTRWRLKPEPVSPALCVPNRMFCEEWLGLYGP
jgi:hypothetical protein